MAFKMIVAFPKPFVWLY